MEEAARQVDESVEEAARQVDESVEEAARQVDQSLECLHINEIEVLMQLKLRTRERRAITSI
ncbi:hypothetical protein DVH24_027765 [Malus domestica]|uniref:Uncharacterized protein n=1 Tax=Malus domestica TaxID=3750 RepID=A0A498H898_MALDO|nr:hypothetical protein DVH24_027765 [Malus domestica]